MESFERFSHGVFDLALQFASGLHHSQCRKGTPIPYLSHLMAVSALVLEAGGDEDLAIAALLHDAVEDQGGAPTLQIIPRMFGDRVANVVMDCSDTIVNRSRGGASGKSGIWSTFGKDAVVCLRSRLGRMPAARENADRDLLVSHNQKCRKCGKLLRNAEAKSTSDQMDRQVPAVGVCTFCERTFAVPLSAMKRVADAQENLRVQFAEHKCKREDS